MARKNHRDAQKRRSSRVLVAGQEYSADLDPTALSDLHLTLKASTSTSTSNPANHRTHDALGGPGFSPLIRALQASAFLTAVFYFFDGELVCAAFALSCLGGLALIPEEIRVDSSTMWTLAQFDTFGALRFDHYLRFLVTKLAVVWRSIVTLHKTAVNYSFTVSISEKPSLTELQDLLEGRVPLLLTYDNIKSKHDESDDDDERELSRRSSLASTTVTDECFRESLDLSGMDLDVTRTSFIDYEKPEVTEYLALEDQDVSEYFTIEDDGWPEAESDSTISDAEDEAVSMATMEEAPQSQSRKVPLRSICIPVLPLETLDRTKDHRTRSNSVSAPLDPLVVPHVKSLVEEANIATWKLPTVRPEAVPLLAQHKTVPKRKISVNVTSMKPLPRLVVKARPSTLTPPQNVQRMLDQVERMMREVHDLLAVGREVLRSVESPSEELAKESKKTVHFSESVEVIESAYNVDGEDELELRTSLSYGADEIEFMSDEFFATAQFSPAC